MVTRSRAWLGEGGRRVRSSKSSFFLDILMSVHMSLHFLVSFVLEFLTGLQHGVFMGFKGDNLG